MEPYRSFNNIYIKIQTLKCFSNVGIEMLVVTIQFTSVRMRVCWYGYVFVRFVHVNISAIYYMWNVYYWYAVTEDFSAALQRTFSVLTHKFNLVELLVVALIANEGSILVMKGEYFEELGHCFMSQSFIDLLFGLSKQSSFFAVLYFRIGYCHILHT